MSLPEAGKALSSTVEALKGNPSCLAAIILAGIFAALTYLALQREADRNEKRMAAAIEIIQRCYPNQERPP